jgi:hypothetical protein
MLLFVLALALSDATSADSICPGLPPARPVGYQTVDSLLGEVRRQTFPELAGADITLNEIRSSSDYFTSGTEVRTILSPARHRSYLVYVNPRLFRDPPPLDAVRAVLAHELSHVVDYRRRTAGGLTRFTVRYLTHNQAAYERATDREALKRGYGCGLIAYREWLYRHLTPKAAAAKRKDYLTPEEIRRWLLSGAPAPSGRPRE